MKAIKCLSGMIEDEIKDSEEEGSEKVNEEKVGAEKDGKSPETGR